VLQSTGRQLSWFESTVQLVKAINWFFILLRGVLALRLTLSGDTFLIGLGLLDVVSIVLAARNAVVAIAIDSWPWGVVVPLTYCAGLIWSPAVSSWAGRQVLGVGVLSVFSALAVLKVWFGVAYTVGPASFVAVVSSGPYRLLRHPQALVVIVLVGLLAAANPTAGNLAAAVFLTSALCASVIREEIFLSSVPAWVEYSRRVPWRLVPGVW
jgi:protein-S-isoprenylcysteine O-methyltransferase Ste14